MAARLHVPARPGEYTGVRHRTGGGTRHPESDCVCTYLQHVLHVAIMFLLLIFSIASNGNDSGA